ncbi:hypothetical protein C8R45DRAFT_1053441 [Mycena sanguinolenta]|nr:hypothetical protein C8R45DRAFT_1053441 [Mycena sanguinolenta]
MVTVFITCVLCWESPLPGLYGQTKAFFGTVEQQGRLTLHLHLLLWIVSALSPQMIRDRLMSPDSTFQKKIIEYLEAAHQGEFIQGSLREVEARIGFKPHPTPEELDHQSSAEYKVPLFTLPSVPPPFCQLHKKKDITCNICKNWDQWKLAYENEVDDIWWRTNLHTCKTSIQDSVEDARKKDWRKQSPEKHIRTKPFWERRGCMSKKGVCKARFPRDTFDQTTIDTDGHINLKKKEPYLNTMSKVLTYFSRSNTDVTSLMSGTAVKAMVSYVSDYVSKIGLKTYQAFASVYDVFERNEETLASGLTGFETSKTLMRQMINSMTTKMEIGSPMAAMYILGNPDHYQSHQYVNFSWRPYVIFVKRHWEELAGRELTEDLDDFVTIKRHEDGTFIAGSNIDDYRFRPMAYNSLNLYEWVQTSAKKGRTRAQLRKFDEQMKQLRLCPEDTDDSDNDYENVKKAKKYRATQHEFLPANKSSYRTHTVHCDFRKFKTIIPNFLGGAIPRSDKGDREFYCMTKLTLFKPWRDPGELKKPEFSWDETFRDHEFSPRQKELIANFSLRYECGSPGH